MTNIKKFIYIFLIILTTFLFSACSKNMPIDGIHSLLTSTVPIAGTVDEKWMNHIDDMSHLKDGIHLRAYGQSNPVDAYKIGAAIAINAGPKVVGISCLRKK